MKRLRADFNLSQQSRPRESAAEEGLRLTLPSIILLGDREQVVRFHLRHQRVRTVRPVSREATAMERGSECSADRGRQTVGLFPDLQYLPRSNLDRNERLRRNSVDVSPARRMQIFDPEAS